MKSTEPFKKAISGHLEGLAAADPLFAETLKKENKNIDDCITYIFNWVKKSGCAGFADEEIFAQAVHYYDEDDIKIGSPVTGGTVVVNHTVELSPEDKDAALDMAKKAAIEKLAAESIDAVALNDDDVAAAKALARDEAIERARQEQKDKIFKKAEKKKPAAPDAIEQTSLF
jgi:PcfK-like protein